MLLKHHQHAYQRVKSPGASQTVKPALFAKRAAVVSYASTKRQERERLFDAMHASDDSEQDGAEPIVHDLDDNEAADDAANSDVNILDEPVPLSMMSTALTQEELEDIQRALATAGGALSTSSSATEQEDEDEKLDGYPDDFWATDKERVFLVGVDIWGRSGTDANRSSFYADNKVTRNEKKSAAAAAEESGVKPKKRKPIKYSVHDSLEELGRLAETAGLKVLGSTYQSLEVPNNSTYIGSGKVAEVARAVRAYRAETVIFDSELAPGQLRNLEKAFGGDQGGVQVCDRTALILDIFSQRAATREGKLQVELAQVEYQLPRLTRMWTHLDRVGGGGQVKGAGEKQIEMDKRILRDKAAALRKELEAVRGHRRAYRKRRAVAPIPVVALVGYTNAGKSTMLNRLTDAGVLAEDKLFATLDPTTRKIRLPGNQEVLLSDTVGFIQKLPTELVAAFRATLEEVQDASVLLHLVDISHPNAAAQCEAVLQVLDDLGVSDIPLVTAWNKLDSCPDTDQVYKVAARRKDTVCVSGRTGEGVEELLTLISDKLAATMKQMEVLLPYSAGDLLDDIHRSGKVQGEVEYTQNGTLLKALVPQHLVGKLLKYSTVPVAEEDVGRAGGKFLDDWDGAEAEFYTGVSSDEEDIVLV